MISPPSDIEQAVAAALSGNTRTIEADAGHRIEAILECAREHDVLALIADQLSSSPRVPDRVRQRCSIERQQHAALDLAREAELRRVLAALAERRIDVLVIKGSHLAYSHYDRPELRARVDSDLLIRREQREDAERLLLQRGYSAQDKVTGELSATQRLFSREGPGDINLLIDLHWRWASPSAFANVLSFDELYAESAAIPALGHAGRGPSAVHALVIACVHRVAHHHDEVDRLKWLLDIDVIARRLDASEWERFVRLVFAREIAAVCGEGLERAAARLGTPLPAVLSESVLMHAASGREPTAAYLTARSQAEVVFADLRSLGWRDRWRLTREHVLPSADYMKRSYAPQSHLPLPALYVLRFVRGARSWLRRRPA